MRIKAYSLVSVLFLFLHAPSVFAALYNWGTTGVADTSTVSRILQMTNNSVDNTVDYSGLSFVVSPWSKHGKWIVYRDSSGTGGNICTMNVASGAANCLTEGFIAPSESVYNPSFGTDNKIYFEKKNSSSVFEIWRMNSDGTDKENLTAAHSGTGERYVKVSPDGQWIAFFQTNALWVAKSDGTLAHKVSNTVQVNDPQHSWSPDSQWLVYQGIEGANAWVYKVRVNGTDNRALTKPPIILNQQTHSWPTWSPDGEKIAFVLWSSWDGTVSHYNIRTIDAEGHSLQGNLDSASTSATEWTEIHGPLSWSPDSQWLTYTKEGGGDKAIFITNVEDPVQKTQLTTHYADNRPIWSPAGDRILFEDAGPG